MRLNTKPHMVIRADGGPQIGSGHIMRCLALAQAWQRQGGRVTLIGRCGSEALLQRLRAAYVEVVPIATPHPDPGDLELLLQTLANCSAAWVVTDGYHLNGSYQKAIRSQGHPLLVIDDNAHLRAYHADVVLNQNLSADNLKYKLDKDTIPLLGTRYALLRQEFFQWRSRPCLISPIARRVLVTLGGGDPDNVTLRVIEALKQMDIPGLQARIVVGHANPFRSELDQALFGTRGNLKLLSHAPDMPALMDWADVAVAAGGSTCWELAFMGLPNILLVLADNQRKIAAELAQRGASKDLGWHSSVSTETLRQTLTDLMLSEESRRSMHLALKPLVDGEGADRVVTQLQSRQFQASIAA